MSINTYPLSTLSATVIDTCGNSVAASAWRQFLILAKDFLFYFLIILIHYFN